MRTIRSIIDDIKSSLYDNILNRYFLILQIVLLLAATIIWARVIVAQNIYIYSATNYFPIQIFFIIFALHIFLSIYSYRNDKNISSLLLGASLFYSILIVVLELLYIIYH